MKSLSEEKFLILLRKPIKNKEDVLEMENARLSFERELSFDEKERVDELTSEGATVSSVWDLVNTKKTYPNAIPVLIKHLSKKYHYKNKEGIVRALSVKEAMGKATPALIEEYNKTPKELASYLWAIGNSVFTTITIIDVEKVLEIVKENSNGESRHMFILALNKVRSEKVDQVLRDLLNDKEVATYASKALGKFKSKK